MTPKSILLSGALAAAIFLLSACGPGDPPPMASPALADTVSQTGAHDDKHEALDMETLPVAFRVAFMSGHVEAGLALYRAGAPDQAAKHLLHPVSETHAAERAGIDALGFEPEIFRSLSTLLEAGEAATEIESLLQEAEANMALMQSQAGGDPVEIIGFLMDTVEEEYAIGVTDTVITDAGEYQDAYGFSVVALKIAQRLESDAADDLVKELEILIEFWPESGPLAESTPTSPGQVFAQVADVRSALLAL